MDRYPNNGNHHQGSSPPTNPSAKKKRKVTNAPAAARRAPVVPEASRYGVVASNNRHDLYGLPPAPFGAGPNSTIYAGNPFDDSSMPSASRGPPPGYPSAAMDYTMRAGAMQQPPLQPPPPLPMQGMNYPPSTNEPRRMQQHFGHSAARPRYSEPAMGMMRAGPPAMPMLRFPRPPAAAARGSPPPPYDGNPCNPNLLPSIFTIGSYTSRMHMSVGNVNVGQSVSNQARPMLEQPNGRGSKASPFLMGSGQEAPLQPYQPPLVHVAGRYVQVPPMSHLPPGLVGSLPYVHLPNPAGNSILEQQLTRPPAANNDPAPPPPEDLLEPLNLDAKDFEDVEEEEEDVRPNLCGECRKNHYLGEDSIMCSAGCALWFHRECVGLSRAAHRLLLLDPDRTEWACHFCQATGVLPLIKLPGWKLVIPDDQIVV